MSEKQLTFNQVKKDNKKFKEKKRIEFNDGEFYLDIFPYFEPTKIKSMMEDIGEVFRYANQNNIEIPNNLVTNFVYCFVVKHFTSIPSPSDPKKLIQGFIDLINSDYFPQIIDAFEPESLDKVFDGLLKGIEVGSQIDKSKEQLNEVVTNETMREVIGLDD